MSLASKRTINNMRHAVGYPQIGRDDPWKSPLNLEPSSIFSIHVQLHVLSVADVTIIHPCKERDQSPTFPQIEQRVTRREKGDELRRIYVVDDVDDTSENPRPHTYIRTPSDRRSICSCSSSSCEAVSPWGTTRHSLASPLSQW
jgi:hypothetical protein